MSFPILRDPEPVGSEMLEAERSIPWLEESLLMSWEANDKVGGTD